MSCHAMAAGKPSKAQARKAPKSRAAGGLDGEGSYCSSSASRRAWYGVPSASIASAAARFAAWALVPVPSGSFTEVPFGRWQMHVQPPGPEWSSTRGSENACAAFVPSRLRAQPSSVLHQEITLCTIACGRGRHPIFAGPPFRASARGRSWARTSGSACGRTRDVSCGCATRRRCRGRAGGRRTRSGRRPDRRPAGAPGAGRRALRCAGGPRSGEREASAGVGSARRLVTRS